MAENRSRMCHSQTKINTTYDVSQSSRKTSPNSQAENKHLLCVTVYQKKIIYVSHFSRKKTTLMCHSLT